MVNLLADYITPDGQNGYREYQVTGHDNEYQVRDILLDYLERSGYNVLALTIVHGDYSMEELREIHAYPAARPAVLEVFVYDEEEVTEDAI